MTPPVATADELATRLASPRQTEITQIKQRGSSLQLRQPLNARRPFGHLDQPRASEQVTDIPQVLTDLVSKIADQLYADWVSVVSDLRQTIASTLQSWSSTTRTSTTNLVMTRSTTTETTAFSLPPHLTFTQGAFLKALSALRSPLLAPPFLQPADVRWSLISPFREPDILDDAKRPDLARQYDEVLNWLHLSTEEMRQATGIGRSTRHYWDTGSGRLSTGRRLNQVHGLVKSLVDRLGAASAQQWFGAGDPTGLELLKAEELTELTRRASAVLFPGAEARGFARERELIAMSERDVDDDASVAATPAQNPLRRRPGPNRRRKTLSDDR